MHIQYTIHTTHITSTHACAHTHTHTYTAHYIYIYIYTYTYIYMQQNQNFKGWLGILMLFCFHRWIVVKCTKKHSERKRIQFNILQK